MKQEELRDSATPTDQDGPKGNYWAMSLILDFTSGIWDYITLPFPIAGPKNKWAFDEGTGYPKTGKILRRKSRRQFRTKAQADRAYRKRRDEIGKEVRKLKLRLSNSTKPKEARHGDLDKAREQFFRECLRESFCVDGRIEESSDLKAKNAEARINFAVDFARQKRAIPAEVLSGVVLSLDSQKRLARALKLANPLKLVDEEIVLNWEALYAHLKPAEYTALINQKVAEQIKELKPAKKFKPLTPSAMAKKVNTKYGLTSKRPEGRPEKI